VLYSGKEVQISYRISSSVFEWVVAKWTDWSVIDEKNANNSNAGGLIEGAKNRVGDFP